MNGSGRSLATGAKRLLPRCGPSWNGDWMSAAPGADCGFGGSRPSCCWACWSVLTARYSSCRTTGPPMRSFPTRAQTHLHLMMHQPLPEMQDLSPRRQILFPWLRLLPFLLKTNRPFPACQLLLLLLQLPTALPARRPTMKTPRHLPLLRGRSTIHPWLPAAQLLHLLPLPEKPQYRLQTAKRPRHLLLPTLHKAGRLLFLLYLRQAAPHRQQATGRPGRCQQPVLLHLYLLPLL